MGMVRFALAMAVVLSHLPLATFQFLSGGLAVQCFFIISGFYMALVLDGKYKDVGLFYSNRLLRLFPTYFVMMAVTAVGLYVFNASGTTTPELMDRITRDPLTLAVLAVENLIMVGQEWLFWFTIDESEPAGARSERALAGRNHHGGVARAVRAAIVEPVDGADVLRHGSLPRPRRLEVDRRHLRGKHRHPARRRLSRCRLRAVAGPLLPGCALPVSVRHAGAQGAAAGVEDAETRGLGSGARHAGRDRVPAARGRHRRACALGGLSADRGDDAVRVRRVQGQRTRPLGRRTLLSHLHDAAVRDRIGADL
ncbi:MAG: hypothetical protein R3C16_11320 [Hyphomonadaceae bacterium]